MSSGISIHLKMKRTPKYVRYYYDLLNLKEDKFSNVGANLLFVNSYFSRGIYTNCVILIKSNDLKDNPKNGIKKIYCDNKKFRISCNSKGFDIYIKNDSVEQLEYLKGTKSIPDKITIEQHYENEYISIGVNFNISKEDFLKYFQEQAQRTSQNQKLRARDCNHYIIHNPKPYQGGRCSPK